VLYIEGSIAINVKRRTNLRSFRMTQVRFVSLFVVATLEKSIREKQ